MSLRAADLSPAGISAGGRDPVLAFAAEELRGHTPATATGVANVRITAGSAAGDGFSVHVREGAVNIHGDSPRGALNGAYWLLEQLGWTWVEPGAAGVTFTPSLILADGDYREDPAFPRRTLVLGQDALHDDWEPWLQWASRNRYNDLFFHDTPPSVFDRGGKRRPESADELDADRKGWMFERWDTNGARISEEARRRGMTLQFGGHHLPTLVPREQFGAHPDWFPLRNGVRDPRYNVCTASSRLRAYLVERVEGFLARFPGAQVYHFWGDDIRGGGWCECGACPPSPPDQALLATNLIAETVERVLPGAQVAHLAYHDTLQPPLSTNPRDNVTLLFAPRERCYAHPIADDSCARNRERYWRPFAELTAAFANARDRIDVFEYYSDAILFKGLAPTHLETLSADARAYQDAGVSNLQDLVVGDRPWVGPPWHAWWAARCLWDANADASRELARFCAAAYGDQGAAMTHYYGRAEVAYRKLLDLHDFQPAPRRDVLDFSDEPRDTLKRKALELAAAAATFAELHAAAAAARAAGAPAREALQAEFVGHVARHLTGRTSAWSHALEGDSADAGTALDDALRALEAIHEWDAAHNTPAHAVISRPMRRAMAIYTAEIQRLIE